ncbi:hypothetical protein B0T10DRAFT_540618 [Thelonectria olida]|uniref:Uncharacterized protein n=1 Tax=Thelonectria olida TaxID=1576542 RepID=A0A9P8VXV7_9HYPO|nr:hypothetical protein B0T10DRAFT_540618 [Thelonectria olida]
MIRSSSAGPAKPKRKGTRSARTLTPSQLARKRANDREAQRAIRARTKEHIEQLERELEERKSKQSSDQTVEELLRRNKALEEELIQLKDNMGVPMTSSPYSASGELSLTSTAYDGDLGTSSDAIPIPRESPFHGDYNYLLDYSEQYVPPPINCESWASTAPCSVLFDASSSSSSADSYSAGYIPTSLPISILPSNNISSLSTSAVGHKDVVKMEYNHVDYPDMITQGLPLPNMRPGEEANHTPCLDTGFGPRKPPLQPDTPQSHPNMSHDQQQQCPWNM